MLGGTQPGMLQVEGGAVVDHPQPLMPDQEVRVPGGAVDVGREGIEPDDVGREVGVGVPVLGRRVGAGAGEEVHAEVGSGAREDQLLYLGIRLGRAERGIDLDDHLLGHRHSERAGELADDHLGDQRARALAGAARTSRRRGRRRRPPSAPAATRPRAAASRSAWRPRSSARLRVALLAPYPGPPGRLA